MRPPLCPVIIRRGTAGWDCRQSLECDIMLIETAARGRLATQQSHTGPPRSLQLNPSDLTRLVAATPQPGLATLPAQIELHSPLLHCITLQWRPGPAGQNLRTSSAISATVHCRGNLILSAVTGHGGSSHCSLPHNQLECLHKLSSVWPA